MRVGGNGTGQEGQAAVGGGTAERESADVRTNSAAVRAVPVLQQSTAGVPIARIGKCEQVEYQFPIVRIVDVIVGVDDKDDLVLITTINGQEVMIRLDDVWDVDKTLASFAQRYTARDPDHLGWFFRMISPPRGEIARLGDIDQYVANAPTGRIEYKILHNKDLDGWADSKRFDGWTVTTCGSRHVLDKCLSELSGGMWCVETSSKTPEQEPTYLYYIDTGRYRDGIETRYSADDAARRSVNADKWNTTCNKGWGALVCGAVLASLAVGAGLWWWGQNSQSTPASPPKDKPKPDDPENETASDHVTVATGEIPQGTVDAARRAFHYGRNATANPKPIHHRHASVRSVGGGTTLLDVTQEEWVHCPLPGATNVTGLPPGLRYFNGSFETLGGVTQASTGCAAHGILMACSGGNEFVVVDGIDPAAPTVRGSVTFSGAVVRGVARVKENQFSALTGSSGSMYVRVYDLSNPDEPDQVSSTFLSGMSGVPVHQEVGPDGIGVIAENGGAGIFDYNSNTYHGTTATSGTPSKVALVPGRNRAYIATSTGVSVVDISNPAQASEQTFIPLTGVTGISVDGNRTVAVARGTQLTLLRQSDHGVESTTTIPGGTLPGGFSAEDVTVDGSMAYLVDSAWGPPIANVLACNISDAANPQYGPVVQPGLIEPTSPSVGITTNGKGMVITSSSSGIFVFGPAGEASIAGVVSPTAPTGASQATIHRSGGQQEPLPVTVHPVIEEIEPLPTTVQAPTGEELKLRIDSRFRHKDGATVNVQVDSPPWLPHLFGQIEGRTPGPAGNITVLAAMTDPYGARQDRTVTLVAGPRPIVTRQPDSQTIYVGGVRTTAFLPVGTFVGTVRIDTATNDFQESDLPTWVNRTGGPNDVTLIFDPPENMIGKALSVKLTGRSSQGIPQSTSWNFVFRNNTLPTRIGSSKPSTARIGWTQRKGDWDGHTVSKEEFTHPLGISSVTPCQPSSGWVSGRSVNQTAAEFGGHPVRSAAAKTTTFCTRVCAPGNRCAEFTDNVDVDGATSGEIATRVLLALAGGLVGIPAGWKYRGKMYNLIPGMTKSSTGPSSGTISVFDSDSRPRWRKIAATILTLGTNAPVIKELKLYVDGRLTPLTSFDVPPVYPVADKPEIVVRSLDGLTGEKVVHVIGRGGRILRKITLTVGGSSLVNPVFSGGDGKGAVELAALSNGTNGSNGYGDDNHI